MTNAQNSKLTSDAHTTAQQQPISNNNKCAAATTTQRQHSCSAHMLRAFALALVGAFMAASAADAQMTFSDGWGKRSMMLKTDHSRSEHAAAAPIDSTGAAAAAAQQQRQQLLREEMAEETMEMLNGEKLREDKENVCHRAYLSSVAQLHEQMMNMYNSYERCKEFAAVKPAKRTVYGMQRG